MRRHAAFAVLFAVAVAVRLLAWLAYRPALRFPDSARYLQVARHLQPDSLRPLGYPVFLRLFSRTGSLASVALAQHLIGLALVAGIYLFLLRRGAPAWLAALASAPLALDAYQIDVEQYVLAETVFLAMLLLALGCLLWRERPGPVLAATTGLLLAAAALTRMAGLPLIVAPVLYLAWRRLGWLRIVALAGGFAVPLLAYAADYHAAHGRYALSGNTGLFLYGRVAPVADCRGLHGLTPTERLLCEPTPPGRRVTGPEFYDWNRQSPAARLPAMHRGPTLGRFARRVVVEQPLDVARVLTHDVVHYFLPGRAVSPQDACPDFWQFHTSSPGPLAVCSTGAVKVGWLGVMTVDFRNRPAAHAVHPRLAAILRPYQKVVFTPGPLLALCLAGTLAATLRRRKDGPARRLAADCLLLGATGVLLVLVSSATAVFDYRYGLQLVALLPAGAGLALTALHARHGEDRLAERRRPAALQGPGARHDKPVPDAQDRSVRG